MSRRAFDPYLNLVHVDIRPVVVRLLDRLGDKDQDRTLQHSLAVVQLTAAMAIELGLSPAEIEAAKVAAMLHDVGKLKVPEIVLCKHGGLELDEMRAMRLHPVHGEQILRPVRGFDHVRDVVRHHHERWDGTGYPDKLAGEAIPPVARVVAVADTYDAIVADRVYRPGRPAAVALSEIQRHRGSQFDPRVVDALDAVARRHLLPAAAAHLRLGAV